MPQSESQDDSHKAQDAAADLQRRASEMLAATSDSTTETEFYSPIPAGYQKGRHRYVVVLGTVISGLGKGIFASSLAKLLKDKGLCVAPIKMEGYLNIDSGTLNPFRHGEVFVLDDGTETDMDLGTYERMLDQDLGGHNFVTAGQIYRDILDRERSGKYLGRDVQMIPHVTGEIKRRLRELAMHGDGTRPADVVFVEVGGTVGDYENGLYIEALRELAFEEGPRSTCFVALTYIIEPAALGEQKSKAAQLGIKRVMEAGIQPTLIACRATNPITPTVEQKIAMFSNVPLRRIFSMHDRKSIYTIPEAMRQEGIDREILSVLELHDRVDLSHEDAERAEWSQYIAMMEAPRTRHIRIGIAGKYASVRDAYASIDKAIEHCSTHLSCQVETSWIEAQEITEDNAASRLSELDGLIVPGGFGMRGVEGKIACAAYARTSQLPYLGICLGFQTAVIEFARSVAGIENAHSSEFMKTNTTNVISELPDQKKIEQLGGTMRLGGQHVHIEPGTFAHHLYGAATVRQRFRHRYEVEPDLIETLTNAGLIFSGRHPDHQIMQILELPGPGQGGAHGVEHPYYLATQFHPELTGRPMRPQPVFMGLIAAAIMRKYPDAEIPDRWVRSGRTNGTAKTSVS